MADKKQSIDEELSLSLFYNLSILKRACKTTPEFEEYLSNTMFLKSNTKAFIHITHFIFNILDEKEFKAKFYWPIIEKKFENSYRTSSIEFINKLIIKSHLKQEKISMKQVVHPTGKKFISLLLDLTSLAIKEVMRRRGFSAGKSINVEMVLETCTNMKQVENEITSEIKEEVLCVSQKVKEIRDLLELVYPFGENSMSLQAYIESWHAVNKVKLGEIKEQNARMDLIYKKTADLQEYARHLLQNETYEPFVPSDEAIKDLSDFYEEINPTEEATGGTLSFDWLIRQLHKTLPVINKLAADFKSENDERREEELKEITKLSTELEKIEREIDGFNKLVREDLPKLKEDLKEAKEKKKQQEEMNMSIDEITEKAEKLAAKEQMYHEKVKRLLESPKISFDFSKNLLNHGDVNNNRLSMKMWDKEFGNLANESRMQLNSTLNQSIAANISRRPERSMRPPERPQDRRRFNAMELLNEATTSSRLAQKRHTGAIPKHSFSIKAPSPNPRFSSTLLYPNNNTPHFDCSILSSMRASPVIEEFSFENFDDSMKPMNFEDNLQKENLPPTSLKETVLSERVIKPQRILLEDATMNNNSDSTLKTSETTVLKQFTNSSQEENDSLEALLLRNVQNDENLFNISDSVLNAIED